MHTATERLRHICSTQCLVLLLTCVSAAASTSETETICQRQPQLVQQLSALRQQHHVPVLQVVLLDGCAPSGQSRILFGADAQTPMRWGSITKTITALTVLRLVAEQKIQLDAPLRDYVPDHYWHNRWQQQHPIRVIHLLELRAGLPDLSGVEFNSNEPLTTAAAMAINPSQRHVLWPPGLQHAYSNLVPGLTQLLIEQVTGQSFARVVQETLFDPWHWPTAGFVPDPDLPGGFREDGVTPIPYWHMTFPAYGALNASIDEMGQLLEQLALRQLPVTTMAHLERVHSRLAAPNFVFDYAAGIYPRVANGQVWQTHGGDADGYRSRLAYLPAHPGRGYVVVINTDNPALLRRLERLLQDYLTQDLQLPVLDSATVSADLARWVGEYYPSSVRFGVQRWQHGELPTIQVTRRSHGLAVTRAGRTQRLFPVADGQFRRQGDPVPTVVFFERQGSTYLQGELGHYVRLDQCPEFMQDNVVCGKAAL